MVRIGPPDVRYYLGSVSHSVEHLPKWYQIIALCGIVFVIYLRGNPVVEWLVVNLHSSFGTDFIWYAGYQQLLEQMSFNERLCFTLYGISLAVVIVLIYQAFCTDRYGIASPAMQMFPDRKSCTIGVFVALCAAETVRVRSDMASTLGTKGTLSNIVINGFVGLEENGHDPLLASSNPHFIVQAELIKEFFKSVITTRIPVASVAVAFRLSRDIPRNTHSGLRWYMATIAVVMALRDIFIMYAENDWGSVSHWTAILWAAAFVGTVNFIYGPSKRAGMVATVTARQSFSEAIKGIVTCTALGCIAPLMVLTLLVSVHVVELISLWLLVSLCIVWVPAIVDSCSTDYITLMTGAVAFLGHAMGHLTVKGSLRFALILGVWWLAACLIYNVAMNITNSRYGGIAVVLWFVFWVISPPTPTLDDGFARRAESSDGLNEVDAMMAHITGSASAPTPTTTAMAVANEAGDNVASFIGNRLTWMCLLADYDAEEGPQPAAQGLFNTAIPDRARLDNGQELFYSVVQVAVLICAVAAAINWYRARRIDNDTAVRMRRSGAILASPGILLRKGIRTLILVFCVGTFLLSAWTFRECILPIIARFLPDFIARGISLSVGCSVLGALMDMKETMYDLVARVLGLLDPPVVAEVGPLGFNGPTNISDSDEDSKADEYIFEER